MSTPINIKGVIAATGLKLVARVNLPSAASTGVVVTAATPVAAGASAAAPSMTVTLGVVSFFYLPLFEFPAGSSQYGVVGLAATVNLPDTTTAPYTAEVRSVDSGTTMTSHAAILTAFEASATVKASEQVPDTFLGGMINAGVWGAPVSALTTQAKADVTASVPTAAANATASAAAVLADPTKKLTTDSSGRVTTGNPYIRPA